MKKILIISDNIELVKHFMDVETYLPEGLANFNYNYSSVNKSPQGLIDLGLTSIDVKNEKNIDILVNSFDLIISAHCKQIFPELLVRKVRCINIHPGFNPYNRGWYPQVFSIINKLPIGCTVHIMDSDIDHGEIIYQSQVEVDIDDTSLDVYKKVLNEEKRIIKDNIISIILGGYSLLKPHVEGNYNGIKDFNDLRKLDLSNVGTLGEHIDLLRALTHGQFKNGYFNDDRGNKVYVKINFEVESDFE
ncbi:hypothetical protein BCT51_22975 [Vibrio lentus]|nr:hypothetical protein BCT51_22975 [Vibrio lentus]